MMQEPAAAAHKHMNVMEDQNGTMGRKTVEKQENVQNRTEGKVSTKNVYHGKRIFQSYSCHLCAFSTRIRVDLLAHKTKVHGPGCPAPLICPQCGLGTANAKGLKIHITSVHGKSRDEGSNESDKMKQGQPKNQVNSDVMGNVKIGQVAFVGVEGTDFEYE